MFKYKAKKGGSDKLFQDEEVLDTFNLKLEGVYYWGEAWGENKLMEAHDGVCGIFVGTDADGYNFIIGSKTVDCREIATMLREKFEARGGGKSQMIQGSLVASADAIKNAL